MTETKTTAIAEGTASCDQMKLYRSGEEIARGVRCSREEAIASGQLRAELVAQIAGELNEVTEAWSLGRGSVAEGELRFKQDAGESGIEFALQEGGGGGAGCGQILGATGKCAAGLSDYARCAG